MIMMSKMKGKTVPKPFWYFTECVLFLTLWELLLWGQNPGLMADDSGEMAASAYGLGLPHPPAYPLFDLLGHFFCWLPVGTPAFRLNLFSQFLIFGSLVLIVETCRKTVELHWVNSGKKQTNVSEALYFSLALILVSSRGVFRQCLTAKGCIYALTLFATSFVLWIWVKGKGTLSQKNFYLILLVWSVGMANHWESLVLWLPLLVFFYYQVSPKPIWRDLLFGANAVIFGFSIYLYLPLRAILNCKPCWGYPVQLKLFYWVISRQLVSGVERWIQDFSFYNDSGRELLRIEILDWVPGFFVFCFLGIVFLFLSKFKWAWPFFLLFVPSFLGVWAIHERQNIYLLRVYLVPLSGIMIVFGFWGFLFLAGFLKVARKSKIISVLLVFISGAWFAWILQTEGRAGYVLTEDFGVNVLKNLPRNAILLAGGDPFVMPIWYERYVKNKRPDILFEPSVFLLHGWGWKQLSDQSPELGASFGSLSLFQDRMSALSKASRPLFFSNGWNPLEIPLRKMKGTLVPSGLVYSWESFPGSEKAVIHPPGFIFMTERFRGLDQFWNSPYLDPASREIYHYYATQGF